MLVTGLNIGSNGFRVLILYKLRSCFFFPHRFRIDAWKSNCNSRIIYAFWMKFAHMITQWIKGKGDKSYVIVFKSFGCIALNFNGIKVILRLRFQPYHLPNKTIKNWVQKHDHANTLDFRTLLVFPPVFVPRNRYPSRAIHLETIAINFNSADFRFSHWNCLYGIVVSNDDVKHSLCLLYVSVDSSVNACCYAINILPWIGWNKKKKRRILTLCPFICLFAPIIVR